MYLLRHSAAPLDWRSSKEEETYNECVRVVCVVDVVCFFFLSYFLVLLLHHHHLVLALFGWLESLRPFLFTPCNTFSKVSSTHIHTIKKRTDLFDPFSSCLVCFHVKLLFIYIFIAVM